MKGSAWEGSTETDGGKLNRVIHQSAESGLGRGSFRLESPAVR